MHSLFTFRWNSRHRLRRIHLQHSQLEQAVFPLACPKDESQKYCYPLDGLIKNDVSAVCDLEILRLAGSQEK